MAKKKIIYSKPAADPTIDRYVAELSTRLPTAQFEIVRGFNNKPHILHLNDDAQAWQTAVKGKLARVPRIILTIHHTRISFKTFLAAALAHKIIVFTEQTKIKLARWPLSGKKVVVIPRGVTTPDFVSQKAARDFVTTKLGSAETCWIGFSQTLEQNPTFLPYLRAFEIVVLEPTKIDCPYFALEAGAAGRAVIAIGHSGFSELLTNMETGILVRPNNQKELTEAMRYLAENPEKGALFGRNLKKRVERYFSTKTMVRKTVDLYNE